MGQLLFSIFVGWFTALIFTAFASHNYLHPITVVASISSFLFTNDDLPCAFCLVRIGASIIAPIIDLAHLFATLFITVLTQSHKHYCCNRTRFQFVAFSVRRIALAMIHSFHPVMDFFMLLYEMFCLVSWKSSVTWLFILVSWPQLAICQLISPVWALSDWGEVFFRIRHKFSIKHQFTSLIIVLKNHAVLAPSLSTYQLFFIPALMQCQYGECG